MIGFLQQTAPATVSPGTPVVTTPVVPAAPATGMPQLDLTTFGNQIFWLVVALGLTYWLLSRVALPRIAGVIADRQGAITGDLGAAEEFKRRAREAEAAYDRALAEARAEANGIIAENRAAIQGDLDAAIAHADAEIAARTAESETRINEIKARSIDDARSVARDVTAQLVDTLGGTAEPAAINTAVDQRLKGAA